MNGGAPVLLSPPSQGALAPLPPSVAELLRRTGRRGGGFVVHSVVDG